MNSIERHAARYQRRSAARAAKKAARNEQYGVFDRIFSFENLYDSYKKCCRGVGWKASTQKYRANAACNIVRTKDELTSGRWKSKGFNEFDIFERGKPRHIRSVHISERVIQRCLCDYALVPMLGSSFIYDNGASMEGKGIDFAMNRLNCHLQRHFRKYGTEGYVLTFDFSKFFDNAAHAPVFENIEKRFTDLRTIAAAEYFVQAFGDHGLGLGSQVSQICALALPNRLDHYIKEVLGIKCYARYMDDGYLIHPSKEYLEHCCDEIAGICAGLGIKLNQKKTKIIKLSHGFTFLKTRYSLTAAGAVVRRLNPKGATTMRRKLRKFRRWVDAGKMTVEDVRTSLCSWFGHVRRCRSYRTTMKMQEYFNDLFLKGGIKPCTTS